MKICLLVIAIIALCCAVDARPKVRRSAGYGGYASSPVTSSVVEPVVQMDHSTGYGAKKVHTTPVVAPVVEPVVQMDHSTGYGAKKVHTTPVVAPVILKETPTVTEKVETIEITDPALVSLCMSRVTGSVFYLPHPTRQEAYIQCDEYGRAFLKTCPWGTIFSQNLVCENPEDLHPVEEHSNVVVEVTPSVTLDQTVGSYGSAPVFQAEQSQGTIETSRVEVMTEAPEFRELCMTKAASYGYGAETTFYIAHPTDQHRYIQCDQYGRAFLRECPMNLIFTRNLVCERIGEEVIEPIAPVAPEAPIEPVAMEMPTTGYSSSKSYGAAAVVSAPHMDMPVVEKHRNVEHTFVREAPEFRQLCMSKINYGGHVKSIFYIPHPTKQTFFIQCDEFGKAFVRECPVNTVFTLNLACENIDDLHAIEEQETVVPETLALDNTQTGSYGSAPVFTAPVVENAETHSHMEMVQEAPEFRELCLTKSSSYGGQISSVFYIPHPTNKGMYIQCNEFGTAYLKTCPIGTIFTARLTCERVTDVFEEETVMTERPTTITRVETPVVPEPVIMREQPKSYNSYTRVETPVVPEPVIMREQPKSYTKVETPVVPKPVIMREVPSVPVVHQPISYAKSY